MSEHKQRVIYICEYRGDFIKDVDGFVKYWPDGPGGYLTAADLRVIADELDRRNEEWNKHIEENL